MDNIFPEDIDENGFEEDLDNVIPFNSEEPLAPFLIERLY